MTHVNSGRFLVSTYYGCLIVYFQLRVFPDYHVAQWLMIICGASIHVCYHIYKEYIFILGISQRKITSKAKPVIWYAMEVCFEQNILTIVGISRIGQNDANIMSV